MKTKVLICGATGFIGRNTAEFFAGKDNFEVYGTYLKSKPLNNPKIKMVKADLTDKNDVSRVINGMDIIIQAAATTSGAKEIVTKPYIHVTDNALMNALIFRTAYDYKVSHVVFFSCTNMYQSSDVPIKETDFDLNKEIFSSYFGAAWTKVYNEKMCEFYSRIGDTKYTVIRHSNIYGPYDKYDLEKSHVFGATITKVMTAKEGGKIRVWGSGEEERDLLYVSDLVNFIDLAVSKQKNKFELLNAGLGSSISVKELVKKIIALSGKNIDIEYDLSKPSIKTKLCLDTTKAKKTFGWSPEVTLDDGIRKTITWYKNHFNII
ncbi:MAG: NAD-dependent epimerase/dehydratase family protein [Elusimicrobia bacterium]|nr:NAD-dependent epimerase/dehydratase family protein [Elusimicrobiota bacterium]